VLSWLVVFFVRVPTGLRVERRPGSVRVGRRLLDHFDGDLALFETVELLHAQLDVVDRDDVVVVAVVGVAGEAEVALRLVVDEGAVSADGTTRTFPRHRLVTGELVGHEASLLLHQQEEQTEGRLEPPDVRAAGGP
jgi:hypothetical protein